MVNLFALIAIHKGINMSFEGDFNKCKPKHPDIKVLIKAKQQIPGKIDELHQDNYFDEAHRDKLLLATWRYFGVSAFKTVIFMADIDGILVHFEVDYE